MHYIYCFLDWFVYHICIMFVSELNGILIKTTLIIMFEKLTTYQILRRTIQALNFCYPYQKQTRETILKCANDLHFLSTYIYY